MDRAEALQLISKARQVARLAILTTKGPEGMIRAARTGAIIAASEVLNQGIRAAKAALSNRANPGYSLLAPDNARAYVEAKNAAQDAIYEARRLWDLLTEILE